MNNKKRSSKKSENRIVGIFKRKMLSYSKNKQLFIMFLLPIAFYIIFKYLPIFGVQIAFRDYKVMKGIWESEWVGLDNFRFLFTLGSFKEVFWNTLIISGYKLIFGFPAPIIFALLLNEVKRLKAKKFIQTVSYLPHFVSWVILAGVFTQFLSPSLGPINIIFNKVGLTPIYFLADSKWFRGVLVVTHIWKSLGWGSIIYIASISAINPELYEAATIDGANRFHMMRYITIPSITPIITIMAIFAVGSIVKDDFNQIFNLYNEAVYNVGDVLSTYAYRVGMIQMKYSFSAAVSFFKNISSLVLIVSANIITKRINEYGIW